MVARAASRRPHAALVVAVALAVLAAGCVRSAGPGPAGDGGDTPVAGSTLQGTLDVVQGFVVGPVRLTIAPDGADPVGTEDRPVEIASDPPAARTALAADHWVLEAVLLGSDDGIPAGRYVARLSWNDDPRPPVFLVQRRVEADPEGVRLRFDLGPVLATSSTYVLAVETAPAGTGPVVAYALDSTASRNLTWTGVGGAVDGRINPTLEVPAGATLRLTVRNADGLPHNVGLLDGNDSLVTPPGWSLDIGDEGDEAIIEWTPAGPGTYAYVCRYHAGTMRGTLRVGPS